MVIGVQASVKHFGELLQLMMSDVIYEPPQVGLERENMKKYKERRHICSHLCVKFVNLLLIC